MHLCLVLAALSGLAAVGLGAFGAHALNAVLTCGLHYLRDCIGACGAQRLVAALAIAAPSVGYQSAAGFSRWDLGFQWESLSFSTSRRADARRRHTGRWFGYRAQDGSFWL